MLEKAIAFYEKGITPIPVRRGTKNQPLIKWSKWQDQRPARALVERWFGHGDVNIGLVLGKTSGGLLALDFDVMPTWASWKRDHQDLVTMETRTPRPGRHVFFRLPGKAMTTMCLDGLDIKANGYVLGPGSLHPTGKEYKGNGKPILNIDDLGQVLDLVQARREKVSDTVNNPTILSELDHIAIRHDLIGSIKQALPLLVLVDQHTKFMARSSECGRWYICSCPFHSPDKHPSFWVDNRRGLCSCFVPSCRTRQPCGKPMDIFNFYSRLHGVGNRQAILALAAELGV